VEENRVLKDSYGRTIDYLRISVTDRCNLRCTYCMPEGGVEFIPCEKILRYEEIIKLSDIFIAMGIRKIRITGGEPLLRKNILYLVKELGKKPLDELVLTTNGVLLSRYAKGLVESGVKRVNVRDGERAAFAVYRSDAAVLQRISSKREVYRDGGNTRENRYAVQGDAS